MTKEWIKNGRTLGKSHWFVAFTQFKIIMVASSQFAKPGQWNQFFHKAGDFCQMV